MKIIGLMITWNNLEFFKCALKQALNFCDQVLLMEGCSSKHYPKHSTDGTYEYIKNLKANPKLKIIDFDVSRKERYDKIQYAMRQKLLNHSNWNPGDWVTAWDDDMFFFEDDLPKIKEELIKAKNDTIAFMERRFVYNFKFNTIGKGRWFFHRLTKGCFYKPLMTLCYKHGQPYIDRFWINNIYFFHYNYMKLPKRIKARWDMSIEKGNIAAKEMFEKWMQIKWDKDEDIFAHKTKIEVMQFQLGFNIYKGKIPEVLKKHPWRNINDVRLME